MQTHLQENNSKKEKHGLDFGDKDFYLNTARAKNNQSPMQANRGNRPFNKVQLGDLQPFQNAIKSGGRELSSRQGNLSPTTPSKQTHGKVTFERGSTHQESSLNVHAFRSTQMSGLTKRSSNMSVAMMVN